MDFRPTTDGSVTPEAQGTSFFPGGPLGSGFASTPSHADKAGVSRRMFFIGGPD
jgi:hypothetical protein